MSTIHENVQRVQETIAAACDRANRDPSEVTLVAVSKRKPVDDVLAALAAGVRHFGENRLEEAEAKLPAVTSRLNTLPSPTWHMVGHIQSRKAKDVLPLFPVLHSIDSLKLAEKVSRIVVTQQVRPSVFLQVNVSGEPQKYGFDGANWEQDADLRKRLFTELQTIMALDGLQVRGLMTMAPFGAPEAVLRNVFRSLARLNTALANELGQPLHDLSMGMTDDYPLAIEEGATVVRVGRAIFGERDT